MILETVASGGAAASLRTMGFRAAGYPLSSVQGQ
jgi:hypothetical protein